MRIPFYIGGLELSKDKKTIIQIHQALTIS